jgi:hypothetical protein
MLGKEETLFNTGWAAQKSGKHSNKNRQRKLIIDMIVFRCGKAPEYDRISVIGNTKSIR